MDLILRVRSSVDGSTTSSSSSTPSQNVGELTVALCQHVGEPTDGATLTSVRLGRSLAPDQLVAGAGVMSGDELVVGPPGLATGAYQLPTRAVSADLTAGLIRADHGCCNPARRPIGRGNWAPTCRSTIHRSRRYVDVEVDEACRVTLFPRPDAGLNGRTANDVEAAAATSLTGDDVVGLGGSRIAFRAFERNGAEHATGWAGSSSTAPRTGHRSWSNAPTPGSGRSPADPSRGSCRSSPCSPHSLRVSRTYAFTRQVQFLALTLISPVRMIGTAIEELEIRSPQLRRPTRRAPCRTRRGASANSRRFDTPSGSTVCVWYPIWPTWCAVPNCGTIDLWAQVVVLPTS